MRQLPFIFFALLATACGRTEHGEPTEFTLNVDKVERVNGCHIELGFAGGKTGRLAGLHSACGVPNSALTEKNWWGDQPKPMAFAIIIGDCLRLDTTYYCLEEIEPGKSASFKATYKQLRGHTDLLEEIQEGRTDYLADRK